MKKSILVAIALFVLWVVGGAAFAASGDRTPVNKLKHGAPAAGSTCVQGEQRVTAKFVFTCMTTNGWKNYSSASF